MALLLGRNIMIIDHTIVAPSVKAVCTLEPERLARPTYHCVYWMGLGEWEETKT